MRCSVVCGCGRPSGHCECPEPPSECVGLDADLYCAACRDDDTHHGGCEHHLCLCALPQCEQERTSCNTPMRRAASDDARPPHP